MTSVSITAALVVTAALGLSFSTTRRIGIAAIAALCFVYPWLALFVLICAAVLAYLCFKKP